MHLNTWRYITPRIACSIIMSTDIIYMYSIYPNCTVLFTISSVLYTFLRVRADLLALMIDNLSLSDSEIKVQGLLSNVYEP